MCRVHRDVSAVLQETSLTTIPLQTFLMIFSLVMKVIHLSCRPAVPKVNRLTEVPTEKTRGTPPALTNSKKQSSIINHMDLTVMSRVARLLAALPVHRQVPQVVRNHSLVLAVALHLAV